MKQVYKAWIVDAYNQWLRGMKLTIMHAILTNLPRTLITKDLAIVYKWSTFRGTT